MENITIEGITYVLIPKDEYDNGAFFNNEELTNLQNGIKKQKELIADLELQSCKKLNNV